MSREDKLLAKVNRVVNDGRSDLCRANSKYLQHVWHCPKECVSKLPGHGYIHCHCDEGARLLRIFQREAKKVMR